MGSVLSLLSCEITGGPASDAPCFLVIITLSCILSITVLHAVLMDRSLPIKVRTIALALVSTIVFNTFSQVAATQFLCYWQALAGSTVDRWLPSVAYQYW